MPRLVALVIGLPLLTFLSKMASLSAAGLSAWFYGGMTPGVIPARLQEARR